MTNFDIDKIVNYLKPFCGHLNKLYNWNANLTALIPLQILAQEMVDELNSKSCYEKEVTLKAILRPHLIDAHTNDSILIEKLTMWIIKEWGGIKAANEESTKLLIQEFLKSRVAKFDRIASISKVAAYMFPEECIIYDSRVAYSLNWILLSQNAGRKFFPIPEGRNSKMSAFNMDTLIRLKYVHKYVAPDKTSLSNKKYISKIDSELYISKERAYQTLNCLIKEIAKRLWVGQKEKCDQLFFTEMLLFSIADREVFLDITKHFSDDAYTSHQRSIEPSFQ